MQLRNTLGDKRMSGRQIAEFEKDFSAILISQEQVLTMVGGVSTMTLWRWRRDPALAFPDPRPIKGRLYWREGEVLAWLRALEPGMGSRPKRNIEAA